MLSAYSFATPRSCTARLTTGRFSLQPADGRGVHVVGTRHISLRFPIGEPCQGFLPLVWRQLPGRPNRTPRSFARFLPSPVRARISSRSNSAKPPRIVSISRPCGLVVSAQVSLSDLNPAPRSLGPR